MNGLIHLALLIAPVLATVVDVEDFGAVADGTTLASPGINMAIVHISAVGGGIVLARQGVYLIGGIEMKSNVVLHVASNSSLIGSGNRSHWPARDFTYPQGCNPWFPGLIIGGQFGGAIWSYKASNFTVQGGGLIDGAGKYFNGRPGSSPMFLFVQSSNILVEDLQIKDSASWTLVPMFSHQVRFNRLDIGPGPGSHHSTDGFNPVGSTDCHFENSRYSGPGDDCIALKSGIQIDGTPYIDTCQHPTKHIRVNNVTCINAHGITIGSEVSGGIEDVVISNSRILNSPFDGEAPVKIKSNCGRGAYVKDVLFENMTATGVGNAIWIDEQYGAKGLACNLTGTTLIENVRIRNMHVDGAATAYTIVGLAVPGSNKPHIQLTMENVTVTNFRSLGVCQNALVNMINVHPLVPKCSQSNVSLAWV